MGKRIGFTLASIHEGTSVPIWLRALKRADLKESSLFFFPGGRLSSSGDGYLRNQVYKLATGANVDGVIAWTSSLVGDIGDEELNAELEKQRGDWPVVTIGLKLGSYPMVAFDDYTGMCAEIEHFVTVHKAKKIAFMRGPKWHKGAESRFKAYLDSLKKAGIEKDEDLITSPLDWGDGKKGVDELLTTKGLVPGLDFDVLVCASDMLMFTATRYLDELGIAIPGTLKVGGFNDTSSTRLQLVRPTTVRMPAAAMVDKAFDALEAMMEGGKRPDDCLLPSELIVRHSCGCTDPFGGVPNAKERIKGKDDFISWAVEFSHGVFNHDELQTFIDYAVQVDGTMRPSELEKFRQRFDNLCSAFLDRGGDPEDFVEVYRWFLRLLSFSPSFIHYCEANLYPIILTTFTRTNNGRIYRTNERSDILSRFKDNLLLTRDISHLSSMMCESLPDAGIRQAYVILRTEEDGNSKLAAGFTRDKAMVSVEEFPSELILPEKYKSAIENGAYVAEPLFADNEYLGYMLIEVTGIMSGQFIEDIRAAVASAVKGINLLGIASEAKNAAEKAEISSSEFFANVSEGLREPLAELRLSVQSLPPQKRVGMQHQLLKAEHLLDLILSERGELEFKPSIVAPSEFFKEILSPIAQSLSIPEGLPALYVDEDRMRQIADIFSSLSQSNGGSPIHITVALRPIGVSLQISMDGWNPMLQKNNTSLTLAEKIIMLHSGSFHFKGQGIVMTLPFPTLSSGVQMGSNADYTLFIKKSESSPMPDGLSGFPLIMTVLESELTAQFQIPDNVMQIAWDASEERQKGSVALNLLKNHQRTKNMAFLCFGIKGSSLDLWSTLEISVSDNKNSSIYVLGPLPESLSRLAAFGKFVTMSLREEFFFARDSKPSLIILNICDRDFLERLRKEKDYVSVPILVLKDHFMDGEIERVAQIPNLLIANTTLCESEEFVSRLIGIFGGNELLPPLTGALVKNTIAYLNRMATGQVTRQQLADAVKISEDYLTRIFRKDMGISPWDYLNRYRVQLASELLLQTGMTINEIASRTGFQDQAYFCRVFKKVKGMSPGQLRNRAN